MPDEIEKLATEIDNGSNGPAQDQEQQEGPAADEGDGPEGEEADGESPDEVESEPARRPSRRDARISNLLEAQKRSEERAAREEERNARLERQLDEIRGRTGQRQESPEEEQARMSLMTPEERSDFKLNKALKQVEETSRRTQFLASEAADKAAFEAKSQIDPLYARMAPDVEKELDKLRAQGQNVPRQVLFELAVGRAALAARGKTKGQKERGAANLRRETTSPLNGKGDQSASRRRTNDTPAKRLQDVSI
jgi:hypothetical protein